jgi:hypothetical protein
MSSNTEQQPDYVWHEITPNVYQRSMVPLECFFNPLMGWSVWNSIKLSPTLGCTTEADFIDRVRQAWIQILYEQPQLRSTFDFAQSTCTYDSITDAILKDWVEETFLISESPYNAQGTRTKPTLIINPTTREILYRAPHYYTDGIGMILLLSDLISHVAKPKVSPSFGDEKKNLAPNFETAAGISSPSINEVENAASLTNVFLKGQPSIGVPFTTAPHAKHSFTEVRLSLKDSQLLVAACKKKGMTVTQAVHTTLLQSTSDLDTDAEGRTYTSLYTFNWRPHIKSENQKHRAAVYCGSLPMSIASPSSRSFSNLAAEVTTLYTDSARDEQMRKSHSSWWKCLLDIMIASGEPPKLNTPMLSSLGVVENFLGGADRKIEGIEVEDFKFGIDINGPVVGVSLWSWKGRVSLCSGWDEGAFGEGTVVKTLLKGIVERLEEGLGVNLDTDEVN